MAGTSTPGNLSERLRKRREEDEKRIRAARRQAESLIQSELGKVGATANSAAAAVQRSIESDMEDLERTAGRIRTLVLRSWVRALAIAISLLLGISIGSWGLAQWLSFRVRTLVELEEQITEREQTLELLEEKTWGLDLHEGGNGKYVVLPEGALTLDGRDRPQKTEWTVGGRAAIKLTLP